MEAAQTIEAKKHGLRQSQDGHWTLTLILHPSDTPDWLLTAPMGQRLALVVAALKDDAEKKPEEKARKPFSTLLLSQQCALLCADKGFQAWLQKKHPGDFNAFVQKNHGVVNVEAWAANIIRATCVVASRSELDADPKAAALWTTVHSRFLTETGRVTEQR